MPKLEPLFTKEAFDKDLREICTISGNVLYEKCQKLYDQLTDDERAKLSEVNGVPLSIRMAKLLLLVTAQETLESQWGAETLTPKQSSLKRILNKRVF